MSSKYYCLLAYKLIGLPYLISKSGFRSRVGVRTVLHFRFSDGASGLQLCVRAKECLAVNCTLCHSEYYRLALKIYVQHSLSFETWTYEHLSM